MKRLWAPWRERYVKGTGDDEGCVFCRIGSEPSRDRDNYVLHRSERTMVVLNRFPYINGHLMVVPCRHVPDLRSLKAEELGEMIDLVRVSEEALFEGMGCMGINGGWNLGRCAGAGVEGHVHLHVLPRWSGDVNFMTSVAEVRVLSESLESSYDQLLPFFEGRDR
ncbi:HIT domain-containing protein [Candidatus Fermentibacteria bacterium]|nr:HIT domain-containing protein [Candidatus Fermentibacteria bacterium]